MARFALKPSRTLKELGKAIFDLGAIRTIIIGTSDNTKIAALEQDQINGESNISNKILDITADIGTKTTPQIEYHYDGVDPATGTYMLHVVVPDMNGKQVSDAKFADPEFDLSDFATECMGQMVIFGCGR